jgi:hypothetical protein
MAMSSMGMDALPQLNPSTGEPLGATSALRMMEHLAQKQERAYERLYHFLQSYLNLNLNTVTHVPTSSAQQRQSVAIRMNQHNHPSQQGGGGGEMMDDELMEERLSHPFVKRALGSLSCVPLYYSHCLELIAGSRRSEVTRRFLLALTSGYQHAPPIEMRAHDPLAYVGDMLAFVFRSFSVECDLAQGLFSITASSSSSSDKDDGDEKKTHNTGDDNKNDNESEEAEEDALSSIAKSPQAMVSHSMSGVARPLKARILQVVSSLARRAEDQHSEQQQQQHQAQSSHHQRGQQAMMLEEQVEIDAVSVSARQRITSLYSICGLLLFYNYQMNKTMERMLKNSRRSNNAQNRGGNEDNDEEEGEDANEAGGGAAAAASADPDTFYISKQQGSMNPLRETTAECLREASEAYGASLKVFAAMIPNYASPPEDIRHDGHDGESEAQLALLLIKDIVKARQSSPGFESHVLEFGSAGHGSGVLPPSEHVLSMDFICHTILDAAVNHSHNLHLSLSDIPTLTECLTTAKTAGLPDDSAIQWEAEIELRKNDRIEDLVGKATGKMLHDCGLGSVAQAIWSRELASDGDNDSSPASAMATYPGLQPVELTAALKQFDASLYSPPVPTFGDITDTALRSTCRAKTAASVADTYEQIYTTAMQAREEYGEEHLAATFKHTPAQVKQLLSM